LVRPGDPGGVVRMPFGGELKSKFGGGRKHEENLSAQGGDAGCINLAGRLLFQPSYTERLLHPPPCLRIISE
jgi:hypothetical protein